MELVARRCSVKTVLLEISQNYQENTCARASFLIKLQVCNFIKKRLWHRCFPVNFAKFLRSPLLTKHLRWLLLKRSVRVNRSKLFNLMKTNQVLYKVEIKHTTKIQKNIPLNRLILFVLTDE